MTAAAPWSVRLQHLLPRRALSQALGRLAAAHGGRLTEWAVRAFIRRYKVDMSEAAQPDPAAYPSFNAFFTRALAPGVRPLAEAPWLSPVDGAVSQLGAIEGGRVLQAKGHDYTVEALVGGDTALAQALGQGSFATLYLSPRDYHRIHMPCPGRLRRMRHVPGDLFSVNPVTAAHVPGLFARNERVVCVFDGDPGGPGDGPWVMVLVGATVVGSMSTAWHGVVNPPRPGVLRTWDYGGPGRPLAVELAQGQEMGRFLLGSTVVVLTPRRLRFEPSWQPGAPIRMGRAMAWAV